MVEALSDLREPPVPGRFYMVPVISDYPWHGKRRDWPVLGPRHDDAEIFKFDLPHYHVDVRFLSVRYRRWALNQLWHHRRTGDDERDIALVASAYPLSTRGEPVPKGRPMLKKMRCVTASVSTPLLDLSQAKSVRAQMEERYGSPAVPVRRPDGRLLCPHRKVDLSQFEPDGDGVVVCPLHGLRVCVRSGGDG